MALGRLIFASSFASEGVVGAAAEVSGGSRWCQMFQTVLSANEISVDEAGDRLHNLASLLQRAAGTKEGGGGSENSPV